MSLHSYWHKLERVVRDDRVVDRHWQIDFVGRHMLVPACRLEWTIEMALQSRAIENAFGQELESHERLTCSVCYQRWMNYFTERGSK